MLGRLLVLLAVIALGWLSILPQAPQNEKNSSEYNSAVNKAKKPKAIAESFEGRVISVEDGDTFSVRRPDQTVVTVSILAIDAPEFKQESFKKSKKALSDLILNKNVNVNASIKDTPDHFIGSVFVDGQDVGLLQLEKGMAWQYQQFAIDQNAKVRKQYTDAQAKAQSEGAGIWDDKKPIPPWVFRGEQANPIPQSIEVPVTRASVAPPPGRKFILGPRGGCYYLADDGHKVYVKDKSLCAAAETATKP